MALTWGAWSYANSNGMRVGIDDSSSSAVATGSTSFTVTFDIYTGNQYNYSDTQTLNWSSCASGSLSFSNSQATGTSTERKTVTCTHTYAAGSYGTSPGSLTISANVAGTYNGSTPTHARTITIPARPYAAPYAPTGVTATRNSDTQATIAGTHPTDAQHPKDSMSVQMSTYSGSTWGAASNVYTGTGTSYVKTGLSANRIYKFEMRLNNTVGSSAWVAASWVYMTPGAPGAVTATPVATQMQVDWTQTAYTSTSIRHKVERSVNGGTWTSMVQDLPQGTLSWVDPSPPAGSVQYRVSTYLSGNGDLASAWVTSTPTVLNAPPLAPSDLTPDDTTVDVENGVTLTWTHNHGGDGAMQTAYNVRISDDGGATWIDGGEVTTAQTQMVLPSGTYTNGPTYVWQVRTKGNPASGWGPWSTSATIITVQAPDTPPTVTILAPPPSVTSLPVTVTWSYTQPDGDPQIAWECNLLDAGGAVVDTASGADANTTTVLSYPMAAGAVYTIQVRALSSAGVWSTWASSPVVYDMVAPPAASPGRWNVWDDARGWIPADLRFTAGPPVDFLSGPQPIPGVYVYDGSGLATSVIEHDVATLSYRSYRGDGTVDPNAPTYGSGIHGYSEPTSGARHVIIMFPPLPEQYVCTQVEIIWEAVSTLTPASRISIGYHNLGNVVEPVSWLDENIARDVYNLPNPVGGQIYLTLDREAPIAGVPLTMTEIVNEERDGGFGLIIGHDYMIDQVFHGVGRLTKLKYTVQEVTEWLY